MLIPHIKYIESLVVAKKTIDEIVEALARYNLNLPEKALVIIIDTLRDEQPEYFKGKEAADPEWIRKLGIAEMYTYLTNFSFPEPLPSPKNAFNIINDPLMYRLITSLALARITDEDIELVVNGKFNMEYTSEDINMFLKYFFNVSDWVLRDRQSYVKGITDSQLLPYYKIALKGDKDYLLWKLGAAPEKDFGSMLRDMVNDSYYNFKEQGKIAPEVAQKWAGLAIKLTDRIDSLEKEEKDNAKNFLDNFEFKVKSNIEVTSKPKIRHLSELQEEDD